MQVLFSVRLDDEEAAVGRLRSDRDAARGVLGQSQVWSANAHFRKPLLEFDGLDVEVIDLLHDVDTFWVEVEVILCRLNYLGKASVLDVIVNPGRQSIGTAQFQRWKSLIEHGVGV